MPDGFQIATAWVTVKADDANLRADVTAAVKKAAANQDIKIPVNAVVLRLRQSVTDAVQFAQRGHRIDIPVTADTSGLRKVVKDAVRWAAWGHRIEVPLALADRSKLRREVQAAVRWAAWGHRITVPVDAANRATLRRDISDAVRWAAWGHRIEVPVVVKDPMELRRQVLAAVRWASWGHRIDIGVNLNTAGTLAQIAVIQAALAGLNATVRVGVNSTSSAFSSGGANAQKFGLIAAAVLAGITVAAPMAAAAITATLPIAFGAMGAFALKSNAQVKAAFADMKTSVGADIREAAAPFRPFLIDAMEEVTEGVREMKGPLSEAFRAAGPLIDNVADGIVGLGTRALPGITTAMERLGPATQQFGEFLGQVGDGIGDMFEAITAGNEVNLAKVWSNMGEGIRTTLVELGQMMGTLTRNEHAVDSIAAAFTLLASSIEVVTKVADVSAPAVLGLLSALDAGMQQVSFWADVVKNVGTVITGGWGESTGKIVTAATATKQLGDAAKQAQGSNNVFAGAAAATKAALEGQKKAADDLRQAILALNDVQRGGVDARAAMEQAIDDATAGFKGQAGALRMVNGELDLNGQKARDQWGLLSKIASATGEASAATLESTKSYTAANAVYEKGRAQFVKLAQQMGLTRKEADALAARMLKMPSKEVQFKGNMADLDRAIGAAQKKVDGLKQKRKTAIGADKRVLDAEVAAAQRRVNSLRQQKLAKLFAQDNTGAAVRSALAQMSRVQNKTVYINSVYTYSSMGNFRAAHGRASGGLVPRYAEGGDVQLAPNGFIRGPGSGRSDSILAMFASGAVGRISDTEFVVNAASTRRYLPLLEAINAGRLTVADSFASGGKVKKMSQAEKDRRARQTEARTTLSREVTLTDMSIRAGVKNAEISSWLGKERDESTLINTLNKLQLDVAKSGFGQRTNHALQMQINATARSLFAQNDALDKVTASLEKARTGLDDLKGKFDSLKSSISSSLVEFGNITKVGKWGTSVDTILGQMRSDTSRTSAFSGQLDKLKGMGLNSAMLADIAAAGVTGGGMATATSLLGASPAQVAELNRLQGTLTKSADAAGATVANSMYGAGVRAAEGLVKGLESQQAAIEASMMKIAKSMEGAIRKALGIRSPSTVMAKIGGHVSEGFALGIHRDRRPVAASQAMAQAPVAATTGVAAGGSFAPTFSFHFHGPVYAEREALKRELMAALPAAIPKISEGLRRYDRERAR